MSAGRRVPPRVVTIAANALPGYQASQDVDAAFFQLHPDITEYTRSIIPGEAPEELPPGTIVLVRRCGATRVRAFQLPSDAGVQN